MFLRGMEMFEVYEKSTGICYMVFGIRQVGDFPNFLFYKKGQWVWDGSYHYEPK
jgi:hypothetical protein